MAVTAQALIARHDILAAERENWESLWQEIAERVLPRQADFSIRRSPGTKRTEKILDATAPLALERFAAAMEAMLTPRGARWHRLQANDDSLNRNPSVRRWYDQAADTLFRERYSPSANYASQQHEVYMSLGAFGTGVLNVEEGLGGGLSYRALHLGECLIAENHQGRVDTLFRNFEMTARQARQRWQDSHLPESLLRSAEMDPDRRFTFLHAVYPREERDPKRQDKLHMPFASVVLLREPQHIVSEGGFEEFPFMVSRYVTAPRETYGRSPAMLALPDIKMLNEMEKTNARAAHRLVDPPLLLHDDNLLSRFSLRPGALNFGGVDGQGRQLVHPLTTGSQPQFSLQMTEQKRGVINDAFLVTLFQILVDAPRMTATEVLQRAQEKGALLGPAVGRQQSEALGPMIERELAILQRTGKLPPLPPALIEAQGEYRIEYDGPLSRAQRAEEGVAIARTAEALLPMVQFAPDIMDNFDGDEISRVIAEANGVSAKVIRSVESRETLRAQRKQATELQEVVTAAPGTAAALEKISRLQGGSNA